MDTSDPGSVVLVTVDSRLWDTKETFLRCHWVILGGAGACGAGSCIPGAVEPRWHLL